MSESQEVKLLTARNGFIGVNGVRECVERFVESDASLPDDFWHEKFGIGREIYRMFTKSEYASARHSVEAQKRTNRALEIANYASHLGVSALLPIGDRVLYTDPLVTDGSVELGTIPDPVQFIG